MTARRASPSPSRSAIRSTSPPWTCRTASRRRPRHSPRWSTRPASPSPSRTRTSRCWWPSARRATRSISPRSATTRICRYWIPIKRLPGVGEVLFFGERRYSMRVWLDPDRDGEPRHHRRRRAERHCRAEHPGRGRQDRPVSGAGRHSLRDAGQRGRPPRRPQPVRRHRAARRPGHRRCRQAARRGENRARRAPLFVFGQPQQRANRAAGRRAGRAPGAGLQRARPAEPGQDQDGRAVEALPGGRRATTCSTTRRASCRRR